MTSAAIRPKALLALMIGATFFLLLSAAPAGAATFVVNTTADAPDSNPGDGRCAAASKVCTLRAAVMEHNALGGSDKIQLGAGVHVLTIAGKDEDEALTGDLDVIGGSLSVRGHRDTVIDANQLDRIWDLGPPTCPTCSPISRPAQFDLSRVTLQNGRVVSTPTPDRTPGGRDVGGAIRILLNSGLRIEDALIQTSTAGARGGAIAMPPTAATAAGADPAIITELTDVRMANNSAGVEGGALFNNRVAILTRVIIEDNTVTGTDTTGPFLPRGAGIAQSGDLTLTDVLIDGNSMPVGNGAGIGNRGDPIAQVFGTIHLNRVTLSNNSVGGAGQGGGIANGNGATASLINTTISHNTAGFAGGGIVNAGTVTLDFVTVANNSAPAGASIFTGGPPIGAGNASARLTATILKAGAGPNCVGPPPGPGPPFARLPVSGGDNISSDFSCRLMGPNDRNGVDPLLGPLADNGGFTPTHALLLGSPAIDTVLFNLCPRTDQRGVKRPQDGNFDGTPICDVGSYELKGDDDDDDDDD